jgi:hypothetical protein
MRMGDLLTMLAQQLHALVITFRGAHDRTHVVPRWRTVMQRNAKLVIELDEVDRAVDGSAIHLFGNTGDFLWLSAEPSNLD